MTILLKYVYALSIFVNTFSLVNGMYDYMFERMFRYLSYHPFNSACCSCDH